ncbi:hypothetical protein DENSPDRAFT_845055 [Dentipellis sp. KUC8613]|nr:hypothetical protein DENSPDRAFT_845055 [Dentipellis sp. KUC8613]
MSLLSIVTFPLHLLASLIRFVLTGLRFPLPALRLSLLNIYARFTGQGQPRPPARDPYTVADRWVRALEDETGALCLSRARVDSATGVGAGAGPSSAAPALRSRYGSMGTGGRVLPDFVLGSYEEALRTCQRELRVGCIVLVSEEHDDTAEFKRKTLTDTHFVEVLHANDFVVWGGDVRDREPWSAAQKLQATTYPFVAFVALQPPRSSTFTGGSSSSNSTASPALTVLSRHQGLTPTAAAALTAHIEQQLLPRVAPFLARLRAQAREREVERALRAEQDEAFRRAMERDLEKRRARERKEREERELREREERESAERERVRREKEERRARWKRGVRGTFVGPEREGGMRIGVRLPDGQRLVRAFARGETVSSLYAFVDAHLAPEAEGGEAGGDVEGEGEAGLAELVREFGDADAWWGFKLYTAYPRREIAWIAGVALSNVDGLERGGQLVVEMASQRDSANASVSGDGDGYDTEESE